MRIVCTAAPLHVFCVYIAPYYKCLSKGGEEIIKLDMGMTRRAVSCVNVNRYAI
jgi:hypothetical protein